MRLSILRPYFAIVLLAGLVLPSIGSGAASDEGVTSFLGEELLPAPMLDEVKAEMESRLAAVQQVYDRDPSDAAAIIWLGRRLAYLGRYADAIEVFGTGIEIHPTDARFYRHRGHRYISTRQLPQAIDDLERAADLIAGQQDQVEPDGLPNALGIPTSTLQSNIWYHLGLARYLRGDFSSALDAYQECLKVSNNPDMLVATTHWLYMTLRRLDRVEEAAEVLLPISPDMEIIENHDYQRLLLLYQGNLPLQEIMSDTDDDLTSSTVGYGVGNWHLYNGKTEDAERVFRRILEGSGWAAFGYIAAEAEIARSGD